MVPLTLDDNEGDSGEQKFSKVYGSRHGWCSSDVLSNCRRAEGHELPSQLLPKFLSIILFVYRLRGVSHIVTAESPFNTAPVVVPGYAVCPRIQLSNTGLGGQYCDEYTNLHF
jgi:hypothetical protein